MSLRSQPRSALAAVTRRLPAGKRKILIVAAIAIALTSLLAVTIAVLRHRSRTLAWEAVTPAHREGRLSSRPNTPSRPLDTEGFAPLDLGGCGFGALGHELDLVGCRDGVLYVPRRDDARPFGLLLLLHGGYSGPDKLVSRFVDEADRRGLLLLAPASCAHTWDVILPEQRPGLDVAFIDRALADVFERYPVDPAQIGIAGFSDGGSYALSLGLANGDLFRDVIAFSPGSVADLQRVGAPRIFVVHGRDDEVLPIDECSRVFVPELREAGLDVTYEEYDGGHSTPPEMLARALEWLAAR